VFNTNCNVNNVAIRWTTESEINTNYFEIQRSVDGRNWVSVGSLASTGNSTVAHNYSFTDNSSLQNSFYRIAEFDRNGQVYYSMINHVKCGNEASFALWPNPVISQAWLSASIAASGLAELKITDAKGSVIYSKQVQLFAGNNIISLGAYSFASGHYVVQLTTGAGTKSIKMIKQ
jgi:hypothetical protein